VKSIGRLATAADQESIVDTITSAFFNDPVFGPVFPDPSHRARQAAKMWLPFIRGAARFPWSFVSDRVESVAIWLPPEVNELTPDDERLFEDYLVEHTNPSIADSIITIIKQFEKARPSEPHYYLSFLATHPQHRGRGTGMALLRQSLTQIDAHNAAAYLESTNPVNITRYESVGFTRNQEFATASGQVVTTMWRAPRNGQTL
jgi:GNAT superfamily N-acetyltransferase